MLNRIALLSVVSLLAVVTGARALALDVAERYTFVAREAPKTGLDEGRLPLDIVRWSTDTERDRVFDALSKNDVQALKDALAETPNAGYLRWPGGLEYAIRYARKTPLTGGGEKLTLIVDRPVWVWWKPEASLHTSGSPYAVVQIQVDGRGGEGRVVAVKDAAADKQAGAMVKAAPSIPTLMTDVKREDRS